MSVERIEDERGTTRRTCTLFLLTVVAAVSACTHTTVINLSDMEACWRLSEKTARRTTRVSLANGRELDAQGLVLSPDSTTWRDPRTKTLTTVPSARVLEIRIVSHGRGALEGLGVGLVTGALVGGVLGYAAGDDPSSMVLMTAEQKAAFGAGLGGVGGMLLGAWAGAGGGHWDIYRPETPESLRGLE